MPTITVTVAVAAHAGIHGIHTETVAITVVIEGMFATALEPPSQHY